MILNTPQQQIDHVLTILKNHGSFLSFEELNSKIKQSTIVVEPSILRMILEKLERDKHVFLDPTRGSKYYCVSFEGTLFIGYEKQEILENERLISIGQMTIATKKYNTRLLWATWCAGIAAALLLIWQVWLWYYPTHNEYQGHVLPKKTVEKSK